MSYSSKRLRIGLVGAGTHGRHAVIPAFCYSKHCTLESVTDTNSANLAAIEGWSGLRYTSLSQMLDEVQLDALYVATLPDTHCELTLQGLRHGLHVICEKPMASTLEEAVQMEKAAKEAGRELIIMFENRFHPAYVKIRDWISSGALGRVEAIHLQSLGKHPLAQPRRTHLLNAAGALDCGIHMLDLARFWLGGGEWETVHALGSWFDEPVTNAPHIAILARLDEGAIVTFEDSFSYGLKVEAMPANQAKNTLAIVGTHGVITDVPGTLRTYALKSNAQNAEVAFEVLPHEIEIAKVIDALSQELTGVQDHQSAQLARALDGLRAQQIVDQVNRQCRERRLKGR